ncbi:MAG: hypothetical protein JNL70_18955 [Saprospiraceae bacterium]|nr:hypothetical protein [Saprospiraceae bacterium]
MNQKPSTSRSNNRGLVRRQNTLSRIQRVQERFKELSSLRIEGIKLSTNGIVDKLAEEFCLSTYTVYDFLATDVQERKQVLEDLTGQKTLFE